MTLKDELQSERVAHLDLTGFSRVTAETAVIDCITQLRHEGHTVALVLDGDKLVGILTERDILTKVALDPEALAGTVAAVMTPDPVTVTPETPAADALWLMDNNHFRNLPVISAAGKVLGTMTHQAIIHYLAARYPQEVLNLPPRLQQYPRKQEGG